LACYIAPDRDDQGIAWAQLVANSLIPAGVQVDARELPYPHEKKHGGDIGRLWQEYTRSQPFETYLLSLPATQLAATNKIKGKETSKDYIIPLHYKLEIARALGVENYNGKGYSKNIVCPFHEDKTPSAALHRELGLHCFKCGWKLWKELAAVFGLAWETSTPEPIYRELALGDELLQAMIKAGYSALAFTLEKAYRAGYTPKQQITIQRLVSLGIPTWRARKAFAQMEGREADKRKQNKRALRGKRESVFCGELTAFFLFHEEELILHKNGARGRRAKVKVLPDPDDLAKVFGVNVTRYSEIRHRSNIADWRAEVYALPIDKNPGTHPRKELCKPLGISSTTGRAYDKRAGVIVTPNEKRVELKSAAELPNRPELKATWLETEEVITDKNGHDRFKQFAATKMGYMRALKSVSKHGGSIWMVKRLANDYRRSKEWKNQKHKILGGSQDDTP
jgi:hypothetical protein